MSAPRLWYILALVLVTGLVTLSVVAAPGEKKANEPLPVITPEKVFIDATADAIKLGKDARYYRWISLWNLPTEKLAELFRRVQTVHVNELSRESLIVPPVLVSGHLLRLYLDDYRIDPNVWEQLADAQPVGEPLFHIPAEVEEVSEVLEDTEPYIGKDGKLYKGKWVKKKTGKKKISSALAPWLAETKEGAEAVATLVKLTQSQAPVVSADWFLYQTAIQVDRVPGYYDFLGIKDEKTFQQLVGFVDNKKLVDPGFLQSLRSAVGVDLEVTLQARRLEQHRAVGGGYWRSRDVRLANNKSNPLRVLDDALVFDASEQFGGLPNELWATGIFNQQGVRQDSAPDFIASDKESTSRDARVHVCKSCNVCHANGGLKAIDDWIRNVEDSPPNQLQALDKRQLLDLKQQYTRSLEDALNPDRARADRAVGRCVEGWKWKDWAKALEQAWEWAVDTPVDIKRAARDCGTTPEELRKGLEKYKEETKFIDPVLSAFTRPKPARMQVEIWWEAIPLAQFNRRGFQIPPDIRSIPVDICLKAFPNATWFDKSSRSKDEGVGRIKVPLPWKD